MRAAVAALAVLALAASAGAEPLSWHAPAGCPEAAAVRAQIETALGRPLAPGAPLSLEAAPAGSGWAVRVRVGGAAPARLGERVITAASCAEGVRAAALVLGLLLRAEAASAPAAALPEPQPLGPAAPPADLLAPPPPPADTVTAPPAELGAAAFLAAGAGLQPEPGVGLGLAALLRRGPWQWQISGSYWPAQRVLQGDDSGRGARIDRLGAAALMCRHAAGARLRACLGLDGALLRADDFGTVRDRDNRGLWLAGLGRLAAALPLGRRAALVVGADALVPLVRPRFYFPEQPMQTLFWPAAVAGRLVLATEWRWR